MKVILHYLFKKMENTLILVLGISFGVSGWVAAYAIFRHYTKEQKRASEELARQNREVTEILSRTNNSILGLSEVLRAMQTDKVNVDVESRSIMLSLGKQIDRLVTLIETTLDLRK